MLEKASSLPVVEVGISIYDILRAIKMSESDSERLAIVGFPNVTANAGILCELMQYPIDIISIHSREEAADTLLRLQKKDYSMVLCDMIAYTTAQKLGMKLPAFEMHEWIHFFLLLERMEQSWGEMLNDLISGTEIEPDAETFNSPRYGKILSYLLYRHFLAAQTEEEARVLFAFAVLSVRLIAALDARDMTECDEHVRLFSAEIEYSDENMERICAKLRERFAFDDCI